MALIGGGRYDRSMFVRAEAVSASQRLFAAVMMLVLPGCGSATDAAAQSIAHPDRGNARVEYFVETPGTPAPWPTVVFLHGHQPALDTPGGKAFSDWGVLSDYARHGYLAVSVSLPGYGGSTGPRDFAGPFTQHAVKAVLDRLQKDGVANPGKIVIEGISLGAVTGALVAADDPSIAGLVLISGLYDLPAFLNEPKTPAAAAVRAAVFAQTGGSQLTLTERSALFKASRIRANTLILNGARDDRTDPNQARQLADAINAAGGRADVRIYREFGHEIPFDTREPFVSAFIRSTLNDEGRR
jgi:dipeptidyl aminopeptidase/acylaminoacyl peptidase